MYCKACNYRSGIKRKGTFLFGWLVLVCLFFCFVLCFVLCLFFFIFFIFIFNLCSEKKRTFYKLYTFFNGAPGLSSCRILATFAVDIQTPLVSD